MNNIPESILIELRYQHLTQFRLSLYKRPEFPYLKSMGVGDIFQSFVDEEYGYIGTVHLKHKANDYWAETWYEAMEDIMNIAASIQEHKDKNHLTSEVKIINAHISYMNRFIHKLDNKILYS